MFKGFFLRWVVFLLLWIFCVFFSDGVLQESDDLSVGKDPWGTANGLGWIFEALGLT